MHSSLFLSASYERLAQQVNHHHHHHHIALVYIIYLLCIKCSTKTHIISVLQTNTNKQYNRLKSKRVYFAMHRGSIVIGVR